MLSPGLLILLQGMPADINSQDFLFKAKQQLFRVFPHIGKTNLKIAFFFFTDEIKQADLACQVIFLIVLLGIHHLCEYAHKLLSGSPKPVKSTGFNKVFHGTLIHFRVRHTGDKILKAQERASDRAFLRHSVNHRPSHTLDGCERVPDGTARHGKARFPFIDIRGQNFDAHAPTGEDIFRYLSGIINHGGHQCRHEFQRVIIFQVSGLVRNHRITGGMGFIESVFGKIHHFFINGPRHLLRYSVIHTARNAFFFISVNEIGSFFFHDGLFFLTHGTAHQVASAHGIPAQITHDLHNLFLVYNTAVGRLQDRLKLRAQIGDACRIVLPFDIPGDKIHGAGTVQGNACNDILQVPGLKLLHEVLHPAAFQLEHAVGSSGADGIQDSLVVEINIIDIQADILILFYQLYRILDYRQGTQPQEIHFQKPQLLQSGHGKLGGDTAVGASGKRNVFIRAGRTDNHAGRMHGGMPGKALQTLAHIDKHLYLLIGFIELSQFGIGLQRPVNGDIQLIRYHFGNAVHVGIGEIHYPSHIPDNPLRRHGTEGHDLDHLLRSVFLSHIIYDLLPSFEAEVNINIRHGNTFRVKETFKQQIIFYRVNVGDFQAVGYDTSRR